MIYSNDNIYGARGQVILCWFMADEDGLRKVKWCVHRGRINILKARRDTRGYLYQRVTKSSLSECKDNDKGKTDAALLPVLMAQRGESDKQWVGVLWRRLSTAQTLIPAAAPRSVVFRFLVSPVSMCRRPAAVVLR